ncbi:MAG: hypothetical protein L3K18_02345 [Thermoplasmata archaeon]|nr:hypothetical protein [Thermoplasmata archaeon]MCI4355971.1 hypothetical protein [Thermoplasmata archaeon]
MRAYLLAMGLTALFLGLPLFFAGYVHIGCTVSTSEGTTQFSNCSGANSLEFGGGLLVVAALVLFGASFVPNEQSRYK